MTNILPHIPILRYGEVYESMSFIELKRLDGGEPFAKMSSANAGLIKRDQRPKNRAAAASVLQKFTSDKLIEISKQAGDIFMGASLPLDPNGPLQSPDDYIAQLSATTGLPHALVRANMRKIHQVFTEIDSILDGLTRGLNLSVLDSGMGLHDGVLMSFFPLADSMAAVLPSNSPGVNSIWMPSPVLKVPIALKPGREEPWTPYRIIQSFIAAGMPRGAFSFYPTDHEGSNTLLSVSERALIFGDQKTVEHHAGNPAVQVHGPGWSKVLIGDDLINNWEEYIDVIADSIVRNGGRSCINASSVYAPRHGRELAEALAAKLVNYKPRPVEDEQSALAGFANPAMAEWIDESLTEDLKTPGAEDVTATIRGDSPDYGGRHVVQGGAHYMLPTIVWCESIEHPLANKEFMFPFASVVEIPQEKMLEVIGPSLVVTAITDDADFRAALLKCDKIDRLNLGPLSTAHVEWHQPHEGNLFEFLYKRRSIQVAPSSGGSAPAKEEAQPDEGAIEVDSVKVEAVP